MLLTLLAEQARWFMRHGARDIRKSKELLFAIHWH